MEVAKLVTQPFYNYMLACNSTTIPRHSASCIGGRVEVGGEKKTYMALQCTLEDQLLSHGDGLAGRRDATDVNGANATSSGEVQESKEREVGFFEALHQN